MLDPDPTLSWTWARGSCSHLLPLFSLQCCVGFSPVRRGLSFFLPSPGGPFALSLSAFILGSKHFLAAPPQRVAHAQMVTTV